MQKTSARWIRKRVKIVNLRHDTNLHIKWTRNKKIMGNLTVPVQFSPLPPSQRSIYALLEHRKEANARWGWGGYVEVSHLIQQDLLRSTKGNSFTRKKKKVNLKLGKGGFWITETVKIVNSGQDSNPYNEVINLTCSSHTVEIHFFFF